MESLVSIFITLFTSSKELIYKLFSFNNNKLKYFERRSRTQDRRQHERRNHLISIKFACRREKERRVVII